MKGSLPDYTLIRSSRRSIAVQIKPGGQVIVRAPQEVSDLQVRRFVEKHRERILQHVHTMALVPSPKAPSAEEVGQLYARALSILPEKVAHYTQLLGQKAEGITVTYAKTRFGSCSTKGRLCFSYLLMRYPEAAIDYVVLHEAAHLIHHNHSPAFYQTIARHMPDFRAREALLKQGPEKA